MALTAARREELAKELDVASTWILHRGRSGKLREIAAELRGEEVSGESVEELEARLAAAREKEVEAQVAAAEKHDKTVQAEVAKRTGTKS